MENVEEVKKKSKGKESRDGKRYGLEFKQLSVRPKPVRVCAKDKEKAIIVASFQPAPDYEFLDLILQGGR